MLKLCDTTLGTVTKLPQDWDVTCFRKKNDVPISK